MDVNALRDLLDAYKAGGISMDTALEQLKSLPFEDLGFAKVDHHRALRNGYPEVIFCPGKTDEQICAIAAKLMEGNTTGLLATRATPENAAAIQKILPAAIYHKTARIVEMKAETKKTRGGIICIAAAGTSDMPVAEEAAITAEAMGSAVDRLYDVGVAGIHRLFAGMDHLQKAEVVIVVAGMEGALASVVGGLIDRPVIAVPTSVGYGASFHGLSALLAMLNSCASGVGVVNIDNGFGAACLASRINHLTRAV